MVHVFGLNCEESEHNWSSRLRRLEVHASWDKQSIKIPGLTNYGNALLILMKDPPNLQATNERG